MDTAPYPVTEESDFHERETVAAVKFGIDQVQGITGHTQTVATAVHVVRSLESNTCM